MTDVKKELYLHPPTYFGAPIKSVVGRFVRDRRKTVFLSEEEFALFVGLVWPEKINFKRPSWRGVPIRIVKKPVDLGFELVDDAPKALTTEELRNQLHPRKSFVNTQIDWMRDDHKS